MKREFLTFEEFIHERLEGSDLDQIVKNAIKLFQSEGGDANIDDVDLDEMVKSILEEQKLNIADNGELSHPKLHGDDHGMKMLDEISEEIGLDTEMVFGLLNKAVHNFITQ